VNRDALLDSIAEHADELLQRLHAEEVRYRMCPVCRCDYPLEPHVEGCAYELLALEIQLLRGVQDGGNRVRRIDDRRAAG
jgi:hypothetical protein